MPARTSGARVSFGIFTIADNLQGMRERERERDREKGGGGVGKQRES